MVSLDTAACTRTTPAATSSLGAILLAKVESGAFDARTFKRWLDKALTRKDDRDLLLLDDR